MGENGNIGSNGLRYADAGVDIDAGNRLVDAIGPIAKSTARPGADAALGGFGGLFDLSAAGYGDPLLVAATDGVGTKLRLAVETGIHDTIGVDLVAMCVNDLVVQGAEPLFFLDYFSTADLDVGVARQVVDGIAQGCRAAGAALIGGETAEMPGLYASGDYDLAGFAVGAVERDLLLPSGDLKAGDVVLGLASSGVHSNGFSLVRMIAEREQRNWGDPAPFAPERSLAKALLEPTRIYVEPVLAAIRKTGAVRAAAHITGGGLTENLPRVLPDPLAARIDLSAIPLPAVFGWLQSGGGVARDEMLRTFNCGVGMALVVDAQAADQVRETLIDKGETVFELGELVPRHGDAIVYEGSLDG